MVKNSPSHFYDCLTCARAGVRPDIAMKDKDFCHVRLGQTTEELSQFKASLYWFELFIIPNSGLFANIGSYCRISHFRHSILIRVDTPLLNKNICLSNSSREWNPKVPLLNPTNAQHGFADNITAGPTLRRLYTLHKRHGTTLEQKIT
jgi:hypothetical protein